MVKMTTNYFIESVISNLDRNTYRIEWDQFRSCNAYIGSTQYIADEHGTTHMIVPIRSYRTIVGFADLTLDDFYEYGKYSSTTSQQVTKIYNRDFKYMTRNFVNVNTSGR